MRNDLAINLMFLSGLLLVAVSAWMVWGWPATLAIIGVALLILSVLLAFGQAQ